MTLTRTNGSAPNPDALINRAITDSAQILPSVSKDGAIDSGFGMSSYRGTYLPPFGTRQRERALKDLYHMDEMGLITGAFTGIAKAVASLGWEIKGDDSTDPVFGEMAASQGWRLRRSTGVEYFQEVFRQANFGQGWGTFLTQWMNDFLRYDAGGYVEVIAPGDSYAKPVGAITGLAHLDPMYCYPTGDPRYPCVYYDRYGGLHVMHHSRVIRMVDMDEGDQLRPGYGKSSLSRAVAIAMQEMWISRYITMRLDDKPPPGIDIYGGITKQEMQSVEAQYTQQQQNDIRPLFGQRLRYYTPDPTVLPKIESYDFSAAPEKFDYRVYTDINVDRLAEAIGVDRQELMQLMGGNIGSGSQSLVLNQKSRGKAIGYFLQEVERRLNDLLPDDYTFEFKPRDNQESLEDAEEAKYWTGVAKEAEAVLSPNERRTLLANQIDAIRDAINDTPRANDVQNQAITAEDDTAGAAPVAPTAPQTTEPAPPTPEEAAKSYPTTEIQFVQEVRNALVSATTPNAYIRLDRRGFGITMRSILKRYGEMAYKDGLAQGGVTVDALDPEDQAEYMRVFMEQSGYIGGLAEDVYVTKSITPANASDRAQLWGKSLQQFNDAGLMSAASNAMFIWKRGATSDSCATCVRMDGQVHRFKTFKARGIMPRSSALKCHGFRCLCTLERTTEKARGRF